MHETEIGMESICDWAGGPSSFVAIGVCTRRECHCISNGVNWYDWLSGCRMIECEPHKIVIFIWHHWQHSGTNYDFFLSLCLFLFLKFSGEKMTIALSYLLRFTFVSCGFRLEKAIETKSEMDEIQKKEKKTIKRVINSDRREQINFEYTDSALNSSTMHMKKRRIWCRCSNALRCYMLHWGL